MAGELITADGQVQFGSTLLMGPGTGYAVTDAGVTGWEDSPGFDNTDVLRPASDGAYPGRRYVSSRLVGIPVDINPAEDPSGRSGVALLRALQTATPIHGDEEPLAIRVGGETLMCWARIDTRIAPLGEDWAVLGALGMPLQFLATDPRRYSTTEHAVMVGAPVRSEGLQYAASGGIDRIDYANFGGADVLDWGVDGSFGDGVVLNAGTASTAPRIVFTGPCTTPSIVLQPSGLVLEYDLALVSGETLTVDVRAGTVLLAQAGALSAADRRFTVTARSAMVEEFTLPPGTSEVSFRAEVSDPTASMTVYWRDAYL